MNGFCCPAAEFMASWSIDLAIQLETLEDFLLQHLRCVEIVHRWQQQTQGQGAPDSKVIKLILSSMDQSTAVPNFPSFR